MNAIANETPVLKELIAEACKKINISKENELCRFLNYEGGRIHHFTFKRLKMNESAKLSEMIDSQILKSDNPSMVPPKPRERRSSRESKFQITLSNSQISKVISALEEKEEFELIKLFTPPPSYKQVKKQVLQSIKEDELDPKLFETYFSLVKKKKNS